MTDSGGSRQVTSLTLSRYHGPPHDGAAGTGRLAPTAQRAMSMMVGLWVGLHGAVAFADHRDETPAAPPLTPATVAQDPVNFPTGSCVCLRDPHTGNLVKNCLVQRRSGAAIPLFFCDNGEGLMQERPVPPTWLVIPGEAPDCRRCDEPRRIRSLEVPRHSRK